MRPNDGLEAVDAKCLALGRHNIDALPISLLLRFGAPGRIRTHDPQIRILVPFLGGALATHYIPGDYQHSS